MTSPRIPLLTLAITISQVLFSEMALCQVFDWLHDGYSFNTDMYYDIDNSGIDVEIIGLTGSAQADNTVQTGINQNGVNGIQHAYTFKFSESVDLEFEVSRINRDTTGAFCYNDQLIFPDNSQILSFSEVNVIGDTVFALWGGTTWDGSIQVSYHNINSITFYHGEGMGCDPGAVYISPLKIKRHPFQLIMPNVFTPNSDNINDLLTPLRLNGISKLECTILNRWGNKVYQTDDPYINWDGEDFPNGVYYYIIEAITTTDKQEQLQGFFHLKR